MQADCELIIYEKFFEVSCSFGSLSNLLMGNLQVLYPWLIKWSFIPWWWTLLSQSSFFANTSSTFVPSNSFCILTQSHLALARFLIIHDFDTFFRNCTMFSENLGHELSMDSKFRSIGHWRGRSTSIYTCNSSYYLIK